VAGVANRILHTKISLVDFSDVRECFSVPKRQSHLCFIYSDTCIFIDAV